MIMDNIGKSAAHTSDDPGLPAVVNLIVAHNMPAYRFFAPTVMDIKTNSFRVRLCSSFGGVFAPRVVLFVRAFAQADTAALGIMDFTVFNNPSFAPVWAHCGGLKCGGRRPLRRHLTKCKTGYRNIIYPCFPWKKTERAHADLRQAIVRVAPWELCIKNCLIFLYTSKPPGMSFFLLFLKRRKGLCLIKSDAI